MNRVYKVIWSKAKHCYVVTSEIARSVTKSASSARSAGRKGARRPGNGSSLIHSWRRIG